MISVEWKKSNLNSFYSKMDNILKELPNATKRGLELASEDTRDLALENKRGSKNKDLIPIETKEEKKNIYKSRIHTDKDLFDWATFLEFGTGKYAELEHIGHTSTFKKSGYYFWYAPADKINKKYEEDEIFEYNDEHYPLMTTFNGKKYVLVFSQKPHPFMRTAGFQNRQHNIDIINEEIGKAIGRVMK